MKRNYLELVVGGVVLLAVAGFLLYVNSVRGNALESESYELRAHFDSASGLSPGSEIRLAGVAIGSVRAITLDYDRYQALVIFDVNASAQIPEDSTAEIRMDGLFGSSFIGIVPGGAEDLFANGDVFAYSRGSVDFLDLLGKVVVGK